MTTPYYDVDNSGSLTSGDVLGDATTFVLTVQPKPSISNVVTSTNGYNETMTSGGNYSHTTCSNEEVTTSVPSLIPSLATACGTLRIQTVYTSTLPNIPSSSVDATYAQALAAGSTTISPQNLTNSTQSITFVTTPYYDVDNSGSLTSGDVLGDATTFVLTVQPKPSISNVVTSTNGYNETMTSGGNYSHTTCSNEEVTTSVPSLIPSLATACGILRIQTVYTSTLPNIPSSSVDATYAQALAAGSTTISPQNLTNSTQSITFVTTPYYDVDNSGSLTSGDVLGDATTFVLTVQPKPSISNVVTSTNGYNETMTSGGNYSHTTCSNEEVTTSVPSLIPSLATACGTLRIQTVYTSTLPNIPSSSVDATYAQALAAGSTTISPQNLTNSTQSITFVTTPYYDVDNSGSLTSGDVLGDATTFVLTVQPKPSISNVVTSTNGYNETMTSGGNYSHTTCSNEEVTTSVPSLIPSLATACGTLRIQTVYTSTLPNIPSSSVDATYAQALAAGSTTISPQNLTNSTQSITFVTTPYYDVDNSGSLTLGDVLGDATTFVLTVQPKPSISNVVTSTNGYNETMTSGGNYSIRHVAMKK